MPELMDKFADWFMSKQIGEVFDAFIREHASKFKDAEANAEQKLEWTALYNQYTALFEAQLDSFVSEQGCTKNDFLIAAKEAEGLADVYMQIILAHSEYTLFIQLMVEECKRVAALTPEAVD